MKEGGGSFKNNIHTYSNSTNYLCPPNILAFIHQGVSGGIFILAVITFLQSVATPPPTYSV